MPLNSAEIAAATGQFQQMYAGQTQYSSMIGGMGGLQGPPQVQADQIAGGLMNRAHAIGAPLASLGMGLLGLDPMSIGLKAGMGAFSSGAGFMGAGIAGLGAAAGAGVPLAAMGYAANQMWAGAQQQQAFNQGMRQSFNFMTPFGQGFSNGQLGQINQQMYSMAGQHGPNGEMTSVRELSALAMNMGRMGQATGIQDVSQFSHRFREMVSTLKVVAKEMGTSLQAAQEFVVAMKSSGIFNSGQQRQLATEIRQFSQAGNLATSELTAAASIGAQVSRSIGGRGSAGAFAGIRTLGNIGAAMQSGVLSEEDIYNATGLTGAEGRQALAARQLEQSGNFLRTGRGRMFLASVAGANGQLDPDSVQDWLSGGMGIGDTRGHARRNLHRLGKAGFLRNEGRLRGQALQQFGGMLPTMALMQWASSKGIDINEMDDRSMMFASRQLGMGMDELEDAMKMARNMPRIMEQQRSSTEMGNFQTRMAGMRRTQGIEGVQRKLEQARATVENSLQREGAKFFTGISEMVESYINQMTGVVVEDYDKEVADAFHAAMSGGGMARLDRATATGGKGGLRMGSGMGRLGMTPGLASDRFFGRKSTSQQAAGALQYLSAPGLAAKWLLSSSTGYDRMKKAGYGSLFTGNENDAELQQKMNQVQGLQTAAMTAGKGDVLASSLHAEFRDLYTGEMREANGADRVKVLRDFLTRKAAEGNKDAQSELDKLNKGGLSKGMQMLSATESATNIVQGARTLDNMSSPSFSITSQGYATMEDRNRAYGAAILGKSNLERAAIKNENLISTVDKTSRVLTGIATLGLSELVRWGSDKLGDKIWGPSKEVTGQGVGEYINSTEGKSLISGLASGDPGASDKIQDLLMDRNITPDKEAALRSMLAASKATELRNKLGREPTPAEWAKLNADINRGNKGPKVDAQGAEQVVGGVAYDQAQAAKRQIARELMRSSGKSVRSMLVTGIAYRHDDGSMGLNVDMVNAMSKGLSKEGSKKLHESLLAQMHAAERGSKVTEGSVSTDAGWGDVHDILSQQNAAMQSLGSMSSGDLLKAARQAEAAGAIDQASMLRSLGSSNAQVERRLKRGGGAYAVGGALGLNITRGQLKGLKGLGGEAATEQLLKMAGISDDTGISADTRKELAAMINSKDVNGLRNLASGTSKAGQEVQGALEKKHKAESLDADKQKNPLMAKVEEHLSELRKMYEGDIGTAIKKTAANTWVSAQSDKEKSDTEKGSTNSPQPGK